MSRNLSAADKKFLSRVSEAGGEVLGTTNPYEVMRFKTSLGVGVVYQKANGTRTWNAEAEQVRAHLDNGRGSLAPVEIKGRRKGKDTVSRLIERDGDACFFCGASLAGDITVEHLVAVAHGGPNHISNLFLAHGRCNQTVGHLSAPEKIAIAIENRTKAKGEEA